MGNVSSLHAATESVQMATEVIVKDFRVSVGVSGQTVMDNFTEFLICQN